MNLSAAQRKIVSEALAAGTKLAAETLAKATRRPWDAETEVLSDGPADRFHLYLGGTIQPHFGAFFTEQSRHPVAAAVLFPAESAREAAADFTEGLGASAAKIPDLEKAAVGELANIVSHALVGRLGDALGVVIVLSAPSVSVATRGEHLENAADWIGRDSFMLLSHMTLTSGERRIETWLAFLSDPAFLSRALEAKGAS
jgi:chemotaxis protein CheY-P-specific phosphatase CheC